MAYKLVKPLTKVGVLVNRCWKASLRLWAGSVDMMRTEARTLARRIDNIELQVVLPTPPLPPTKTHFRLSWSRMFWTVASGWSWSVAMKTELFVSLLSLQIVWKFPDNCREQRDNFLLVAVYNSVWQIPIQIEPGKRNFSYKWFTQK